MFIRELNWTEQEKWVWSQLSQGLPADLNNRPGIRRQFNINTNNTAPDTNIISSNFIESILGDSKYLEKIMSKKIIIHNAQFAGLINLQNYKIDIQLNFKNCRFQSELYWLRLKTDKLISFFGCIFDDDINLDSFESASDLFLRSCTLNNLILKNSIVQGGVDLNKTEVKKVFEASSIVIKKNLLMNHGGIFNDLILKGSVVEGNIEMIASKFKGFVDLSSVRTRLDINMKCSDEGVRSYFYNEINLTGSKTGGQIDLAGAIVSSKITLDSIYVGQNIRLDLFEMETGIPGYAIPIYPSYEHVSIIGSHVGRTVNMIGSEITNKLEIDSTKIYSDLNLAKSKLTNTITRITFSEIHNSLKISSSEFHSLDLTGTKIHGDLDLGRSTNNPSSIDMPTIWLENASLILRNAEVKSIQDLHNSWPNKIELQGFKYNNLEGFTTIDKDKFVDRDLKWMKHWLGEKCSALVNLKQMYPQFKTISFSKSSSIQPYIQLAKVLRNHGYVQKANDILYSAKEKELYTSESFFRRTWLFLQKIFVGYGFKIQYSLYLFVMFLFVGTLLFHSTTVHLSSPDNNRSLLDSFFYSLDMIIPIIDLSHAHYSMNLKSWINYYFYIQKILGYILALFIIAALTGITKRFDEQGVTNL